MILILFLLTNAADVRDGRGQEARTVEPRLRLWAPALRGHLENDEVAYGYNIFTGQFTSTTTSEGTTLDLEDDAGLGGQEVVPWIEVAFRQEYDGSGARTAVLFSYLSREWEGSEVQEEGEVFEGTPFPAGSVIEGEFAVHRFRAALEIGFDVAPPSSLLIRLLPQVQFLHLRTDVEGPLGGGSDVTNGLLFGLGVGALWKPFAGAFLEASAEVAGIFGPTVCDLQVCAGAVWGPTRLGLGYEHMAITYHSSGEEMDITLSGPFAAIDVAF